MESTGDVGRRYGGDDGLVAADGIRAETFPHVTVDVDRSHLSNSKRLGPF
jgi:hypothetical protein